MRVLPLTLAICLIAGCATPEQRAAYNRRQYEEQQARAEQYINGLKGTCGAYGLREGSAEFSNCMMQVDQANKNRNAALINAIASQPQPQPAQVPQFRPVAPTQTQCHWIGQYWTCN